MTAFPHHEQVKLILTALTIIFLFNYLWLFIHKKGSSKFLLSLIAATGILSYILPTIISTRDAVSNKAPDFRLDSASLQTEIGDDTFPLQDQVFSALHDNDISFEMTKTVALMEEALEKLEWGRENEPRAHDLAFLQHLDFGDLGERHDFSDEDFSVIPEEDMAITDLEISIKTFEEGIQKYRSEFKKGNERLFYLYLDQTQRRLREETKIQVKKFQDLKDFREIEEKRRKEEKRPQQGIRPGLLASRHAQCFHKVS